MGVGGAGGHALVVSEGGAVGALGTVGVELEDAEGHGFGVGVGGFLAGELLEGSPADVEQDGLEMLVDDGAEVGVVVEPDVDGVVFDGERLAQMLFAQKKLEERDGSDLEAWLQGIASEVLDSAVERG